MTGWIISGRRWLMVAVGAVALQVARLPGQPAVLAGDVASAMADWARRAAPDAMSLLRRHWPAFATIVPAVLTAVRTWPVARLTGGSARLRTSPCAPLSVHELADDGGLPEARPRPVAEQGLVTRRRELALAADPAAPRSARAVLRAAALEWNVDEEVYEDAAMVVTELVANAVDHARTPSTVTIDLDDHGLRVAVRDLCRETVPRVGPADPHAPRGRGLQMVEALSTSWGVTAHADGKTVWAVLPTS